MFSEAKGDGGGGDNRSYRSCKAPVKSSPPTNQHPVFLQARCPSCRPTNSVKALKGTCVSLTLTFWPTKNHSHTMLHHDIITWTKSAVPKDTMNGIFLGALLTLLIACQEGHPTFKESHTSNLHKFFSGRPFGTRPNLEWSLENEAS